MTEQRLLPVGDIELCVETFGDSNEPAIVLIGGMASSMDWWDVEFCEQLAAGRRYVVRYDLRDTGRSKTCPRGEPDYSFSDLVDDAVGVLDALGIERAHVVGISMGGAIGQCVALRHPARVTTLTLLSTTAAVERPTGAAELPPIGAGLSEPPPEPDDWTDNGQVIDYIVAGQRHLVPNGFDEARVRRIAEQIVSRAIDARAGEAHHPALEPGDAVPGTVADIAPPTLVIHGTDDPLFPIGHGEALASDIPEAAYLPLAGVGHETPPPRTWDVVVPALLRHTSEMTV